MRLPVEVARGVYQLGLGGVNVFFVEDGGGIVLIDTGYRAGADAIGAGLTALGRTPKELNAVVVTHLHMDHVGGLAAVKEHTGAEVWMHAADAAGVRCGVRTRELDGADGLVQRGLARLTARLPFWSGEPVAVEHEVADGESLPFAGLIAIHTPGHTAGHLSLLRPDSRGGVLFVGDAATNWVRLSGAPNYEDTTAGGRSLGKLAELDFEIALFSHGWPLRTAAGERFRSRWAVRS